MAGSDPTQGLRGGKLSPTEIRILSKGIDTGFWMDPEFQRPILDLAARAIQMLEDQIAKEDKDKPEAEKRHIIYYTCGTYPRNFIAVNLMDAGRAGTIVAEIKVNEDETDISVSTRQLTAAEACKYGTEADERVDPETGAPQLFLIPNAQDLILNPKVKERMSIEVVRTKDADTDEFYYVCLGNLFDKEGVSHRCTVTHCFAQYEKTAMERVAEIYVYGIRHDTGDEICEVMYPNHIPSSKKAPL